MASLAPSTSGAVLVQEWFHAARTGDIVSLEHHLRLGSHRVSDRDDNSKECMLAIHHAAQQGQLAAVRLFVEKYGVNPDVRSFGSLGWTPLLFAVL